MLLRPPTPAIMRGCVADDKFPIQLKIAREAKQKRSAKKSHSNG